MKILSIGKVLQHKNLNITSIPTESLSDHHDIELYAYVIINGGDGTIRRVLKQLYNLEYIPTFILNPVGSFNFVAKIHNAPKINDVLDSLAKGSIPKTQKHHLFKLNHEIFLFSAGNMGDLQHIFLSETLRFGILKHGILKYLLSFIFLLPIHIIITPFMLMSQNRFFIFTPFRFIKKFGSFYGEVNNISIHLNNEYNLIELDGDIVTMHGEHLLITSAGSVPVVTMR
ncbi:MAG: diacylglycerol kinase family protein [Campylobacterota bacterium]|nr:diacylglycerol kinase family protein [Campylobacterota bacterium]